MVSDASAKRKYKLSAADAEGVRACAFFASDVGCRSGSACKFVHPGVPTAGTQAAAATPTASATDDAAEVVPKKKKAKLAAVVADDSDEVVEPVKKAKKVKQAVPADTAAEPSPAAPAASKKTKKAKLAAAAAQQEEVQQEAPAAKVTKSKATAAAVESEPAVEVAPATISSTATGSAKKICVFFKKGTCRSGEECPFAHVKGPTRGPSKNSATGRAAPAVEKKKAAAAKTTTSKTAVVAADTAASAAKPAAKAAPAVKAAKTPKTKVAAAVAPPLESDPEEESDEEAAPATAAVEVDSDDEEPAVAQPAPVRKTRAAAVPAVAAPAAKTPKRKAAAAAATPAADADSDDDPFGLNSPQPAKKPRSAQPAVPTAAPELRPILLAAAAAAAAVAGPRTTTRAKAAAAKAAPRAPPSTPAAAPPVVPAVVPAAAAVAAAAKVMPPPAAAPVPVASVHSLLASLPISPFPASALEAKAAKAAAAKSKRAAAAAAAAAVMVPHPRADVWADLVARTKAHPAYASLYSFETDEGWACAAPCGPRCNGLPQVVALDCEMCMTQDAATGALNGKDLVRLSVVEGVAGATVLDTLVRPSNPVVEMRSSIHGVTSAILAGVAFDASHAQTAMAALCCPCTVMIGHALHNDLAALRMSHCSVVDTALLYTIQGEPGATPGLRDVAKTVLDKDIQAGAHDSVTDAVTALEVAKFALEKPAAELPAIERGIAGPKPGRNGSSSGAARRNSLLVHRVPAGIAARHLSAVFSKKAMILPQAVGEPEFAEAGGHGKAVVVFPSATHADLAFGTLKGVAKPDATGRLQKRIYLANGDYIQVRKMFRDGGRRASSGDAAAAGTGAAGASEGASDGNDSPAADDDDVDSEEVLLEDDES